MLKASNIYFLVIATVSFGCGSDMPQKGQNDKKQAGSNGDLNHGDEDKSQRTVPDSESEDKESETTEPNETDETEEAEDSNDDSGGSGGLSPGFHQDLSIEVDGITAKYKMVVPEGEGYGVLLYLHGDGGGAFDSDYKGRSADLFRVAEERKFLVIKVLSPFKMSDGSPSWRFGDKLGSAKLLHTLVQEEIYKKYNVDKNRFFVTGHSGGPTFITSIFVPHYGKYYRGGAIPICGGTAPSKSLLQPSQDFLGKFKMYFYTETGDFMYQYVKPTVERYKDAGFDVTNVHPAESGHCDLNTYNVLSAALDTIDK